MAFTYLVKTFWLKFDGNAVHSLADGKDQSTMNNELGKFGASLVTVTAVPNKELGKVTELLDGEVRGKTGLPPLLADDTDTDICSLDHRNVVSTVADTADSLLSEVLDEHRNIGFLSR